MRALRLREGYCVGLCDSAGVSGAGTALPSASLPLVGSGPCTLLALGAERAELSWRITVNNPPPWGRSKNWRPLRVLHQGLGIRTMVLSFVQSLSCVRYLVTPWTAACQAFLSFTISQSLLKFMSIESVMSFSHFILCHPLVLLPSIFPNMRVISNKLALCIR